MKKKVNKSPKKIKRLKVRQRPIPGFLILMVILIIIAIAAIISRSGSLVPFFPNTGPVNIAAGRVAHSTSWTGTSGTATQAVDGNPNSTWQSNHLLPASVTVYLDHPYLINKVVLKVSSSFGSRTETVEVLGSTDNVNFTRIVAPTSYIIGQALTINFSPVLYRYVRVTVSANAQADSAQLAEFEVYEATPAPTSVPTIQSPKIIFGMGSQAGPAMNYRLVKESPVHLLTSWYNGPSDLVWMQVQKNDLIPRLYLNHYLVHLVTWTNLPEVQIQTPHGPACGRPYPVSTQVVDDMKQLAQIYNGNGPMYVTLFTEFPSFTCIDNNWIGNENYWNTLKDNYRKIKDNFHLYAPQSKVAISWGGWLSRYDDTLHQGGRSLFPHFADILTESDFTAFQSMEADNNTQVMLDMTRILGSYKKPVMLAHYKPGQFNPATFDADMKKLFTDDFMNQLISNGLFALSFMDSEYIDKSETSYQLVKNGIIKYGK